MPPTAGPSTRFGDDDATHDFVSEEELHTPTSLSIPDARAMSEVDIIYLDNQGANEFPSETELCGASVLSVVGEQVRCSEAAATARSIALSDSAQSAALSVTERTWRTATVRRAIQAGFAMAALTGILAVYQIRTSQVIRPVNAPATVATTRQSGNRIAGVDNSSVPATPRSSETKDAPGRSTDPPLQQRSFAGRSSTYPLRHIQDGGAAEATSGSRAAAVLDSPLVHARVQPSDASVLQIRDFRDAEDEQENVSPSAESSNRSAISPGDVAAATAAAAATAGPAIRDPEFSVARAANDGADDRRPGVTTGADSGSALPSSDNSAPVRDLLSGYQAAYKNLDARFAKQIWPSVDERALARAFNGLESQTVTLDTCDFTVEAVRAVASCSGSATYVTRIGRRSSHTESRQWTFVLEKSAERWVIGTVEVR